MPEVKSFLLDFCTKWKPENKTVIANCKIGLIQLNRERVVINNKIRMYTTIKTYRGRYSITKYATHVRQIEISNKYLQKLRTTYRKFDLTEFDEWHFGQSITAQIAWSRDDFYPYRCYNCGRYEWAIFKSKDPAYDKWVSSSYDIFNAIGCKSLSSLGGLDETKKLFSKNMTSIKNLVEKIGDLSKLTLEQKNYFL